MTQMIQLEIKLGGPKKYKVDVAALTSLASGHAASHP